MSCAKIRLKSKLTLYLSALEFSTCFQSGQSSIFIVDLLMLLVICENSCFVLGNYSFVLFKVLMIYGIASTIGSDNHREYLTNF